MPDGTLGRLRKRLGTRWASRTSNPVSGSRQAGGGFDSHTLPPQGRGARSMARHDQAQRRGRRGRRRWTKGAAVAGVLVVAVVVGYFAYRAQADLPGQKFPSQGNLHVQTVNEPHEPYNSTPPTSGPHLPYIAPWGVHTKPIANELQVHNLED